MIKQSTRPRVSGLSFIEGIALSSEQGEKNVKRNRSPRSICPSLGIWFEKRLLLSRNDAMEIGRARLRWVVASGRKLCLAVFVEVKRWTRWWVRGFRRDAENCTRDACAPQNQVHGSGLDGAMRWKLGGRASGG
jgi:hypothetical protein